jgi:hypothetical protein
MFFFNMCVRMMKERQVCLCIIKKREDKDVRTFLFVRKKKKKTMVNMDNFL